MRSSHPTSSTRWRPAATRSARTRSSTATPGARRPGRPCATSTAATRPSPRGCPPTARSGPRTGSSPSRSAPRCAAAAHAIAWWTRDSGDTHAALPDPDAVAAAVVRDGGGVVLLHDHDEDRPRSGWTSCWPRRGTSCARPTRRAWPSGRWSRWPERPGRLPPGPAVAIIAGVVVHVVLPAPLATAARRCSRRPASSTSAHDDREPFTAAVAAARDPRAVALLGPFRSADVAEAVEATARPPGWPCSRRWRPGPASRATTSRAATTRPGTAGRCCGSWPATRRWRRGWPPTCALRAARAGGRRAPRLRAPARRPAPDGRAAARRHGRGRGRRRPVRARGRARGRAGPRPRRPPRRRLRRRPGRRPRRRARRHARAAVRAVRRRALRPPRRRRAPGRARGRARRGRPAGRGGGPRGGPAGAARRGRLRRPRRPGGAAGVALAGRLPGGTCAQSARSEA